MKAIAPERRSSTFQNQKVPSVQKSKSSVDDEDDDDDDDDDDDHSSYGARHAALYDVAPKSNRVARGAEHDRKQDKEL